MSLNDPTDPMLHEFSLDARHMTRSAINAIRTALGISGAVGLILGIVLLFWPEKTIAVLAVFLGIYFLVAGVLRLGVGIFSRGMSGGSRALNIILGVLLIFVGAAREFAKTHPDTLIVVTGDHTHSMSVIGTIDDSKPGTDMREKVGIYAEAGFTNYEDKDGDGYPDKIDPSKRLAVVYGNYPDHYETFSPKLDGPYEPAIQNEKKEYVANPAYKDVPGAVFVQGNIPKSGDSGVHSVDDVVLQSAGPGSEGFHGYMEQSDVYRVLADAFALGAKPTN